MDDRIRVRAVSFEVWFEDKHLMRGKEAWMSGSWAGKHHVSDELTNLEYWIEKGWLEVVVERRTALEELLA